MRAGSFFDTAKSINRFALSGAAAPRRSARHLPHRGDASSLVQKSYSVNYPGEFGGGVINLTTKARAQEAVPFDFGRRQRRYGDHRRYRLQLLRAKSDWTGFDNGSRDNPPALQDYFDSGALVNEDQALGRAVGSELVRFSRATAQKVRGGYAKTQREAPYEFYFEYVRTNTPSDPFGGLFVNNLNGNSGTAAVTFSDLHERLWSGGIDVSYKVTPEFTATVGGAFSDTVRVSSRRGFTFRASNNVPAAAAVLRPTCCSRPA